MCFTFDYVSLAAVTVVAMVAVVTKGLVLRLFLLNRALRFVGFFFDDDFFQHVYYIPCCTDRLFTRTPGRPTAILGLSPEKLRGEDVFKVGSSRADSRPCSMA